MPQRAGKRGFPTMSDLVKREEEIRRASNRAEARMTRNVAQAGGLESAKKHSMAVRNWEQEQVRQDLHNIKTASKRSNLLRLQDPETLRYADPELAEDLEDEEYLAALNEFHDEDELKGYGRNYFGYTSQPGSNKPHFHQMRALKNKYSNVKNYYEYTGPKHMDKMTREKLRKQKMLNDDVQEKVKTFTTPEKLKVAGYQAPESVASDEQSGREASDSKKDDKQDVKTSARPPAENESSPGSQPTPSSEIESYMSMKERQTDTKIAKPVESNQVKSETDSPTPTSYDQLSRRTSKVTIVTPPESTRNWDGSSTTGSSMNLPLYRTTKPKTALDLVFDADTYAPDGRLRAMHTMPNFDKSFKEARRARYIRTKHKREMDKELSVNEMFGR